MSHLNHLDLTRDALSSSTLNQALKILGDRWTTQVILGAFLGIQKFDDWQSNLQIPRQTLAQRLKLLTHLNILQTRLYQDKPVRSSYHLTQKGLGLYDCVLMIWSWEQRWGKDSLNIPKQLHHQNCGQQLKPQLVCTACQQPSHIRDLHFELHPNRQLMPTVTEQYRTTRISVADTPGQQLGLRVDRWSLLIIASVMLGCHYFDQMSHALGIGTRVLSNRLAQMIERVFLICEVDLNDTRRRFYKLTPKSRDLLGYMVCLSTWASRHHLHQFSSIQPKHTACGHAFVPRVICNTCCEPLQAWRVQYREHELSAS